MSVTNLVRVKRFGRLALIEVLQTGDRVFTMGVGVLASAASYALAGESPSVSGLVVYGIVGCVTGVVLAIMSASVERKPRPRAG